MKSTIGAVVLCVAGLGLGAPTQAHHSFSAEFDADAPIDLTGVVTKIEWMNPHTFLYIDVEAESGDYENWAIELGSPNGLMRRGWTRNSLKVGDTITVVGSQARDGSHKGNARSVVLSTGQRMFAGSSQPDTEDSAQ